MLYCGSPRHHRHREILVQWHFLVLLQVIPLGLRRQVVITKLGVSCDFTFFILNKSLEMIGTYEDQETKASSVLSCK